MLDYVVTGDVSQITRHLSDLSRRQVPFATASALTKTAKFVQHVGEVFLVHIADAPQVGEGALGDQFVEGVVGLR